MGFISIAEAAVKWGISPRRVQILCSQGRVPGASRFAGVWLLPDDAEKPTDGRTKKARAQKGGKSIKMNNLTDYVSEFFTMLVLHDDLPENGDHDHEALMRGAVSAFLRCENKETALGVYRAFFDCYRPTTEGGTNPFLDLFDVLKRYEENAAVLIDKQRDHYIHSVNVFILGLAIYARNESYRKAFDEAVLADKRYPAAYKTQGEEFFYRWGIASLFHDIGYPVEIAMKQINKFISYASKSKGAYVMFGGLDSLDAIDRIHDDDRFVKPFRKVEPKSGNINPMRPTDLMALRLHETLGVRLDKIQRALHGYAGEMSRNGFVDHGFFSALIILKWYGSLIQECERDPLGFFFPIVDSASAVLLHNYYRNNFTEGKRFSIGPLDPKKNPLAYMLILCDELQEWNRPAYGILDLQRTLASEASLFIGDSSISVTYLTEKGTLPETFSAKKEKFFAELLNIGALFDDGITIDCESFEELIPITDFAFDHASLTPRPLLDNIEKLAISIHELYNAKQLERYPDKPLEYPRFSDLTPSLKYSNMRQAMGILDKLTLIGCVAKPVGSRGEVVEEIVGEELETLAYAEHDAWVKERVDSGWVYGAQKNADLKISPWIIAYDKLPEEIKEYDRDTVRNIPTLLGRVGLAVYRANTEE